MGGNNKKNTPDMKIVFLLKSWLVNEKIIFGWLHINPKNNRR